MFLARVPLRTNSVSLLGESVDPVPAAAFTEVMASVEEPEEQAAEPLSPKSGVQVTAETRESKDADDAPRSGPRLQRPRGVKTDVSDTSANEPSKSAMSPPPNLAARGL